MPHRPLLVTRDLDARDEHGQMLSLWCVHSIYYSPADREVMASHGDRLGSVLLRNLTHWRYALPEEG
jgi:hypothetical protein